MSLEIAPHRIPTKSATAPLPKRSWQKPTETNGTASASSPLPKAGFFSLVN